MKLYVLTDGMVIYAVKAFTLEEAKQAQRFTLTETPPSYYRSWKLLSECNYVGNAKEMC